MTEYVSSYDDSMAPADLEFVKYEKRGHIAYVTINRPEVLNALHTFTHAELRKANWTIFAYQSIRRNVQSCVRVGLPVSAREAGACVRRILPIDDL